MIRLVYFVVSEVTLYSNISIMWREEQETRYLHTNTNMEDSERDTERTSTEQEKNKTRSLYLKEGQLLSHGCGLNMKSPTWSRKLLSFFANDRRIDRR